MFTQEDLILTDAEFELVSRTVYDHCGIMLNESKRDLVRARIARQLRDGVHQTARAYLEHVLADQSSPDFTHFIDAISTNLTSFFREPAHFDYLSKKFLPQLFAEKHKHGERRILGWSAACSTGEEPYTIAMIVKEAMETAPGGPGAYELRILATDISSKVLNAASAGIYEAARLTKVPDPLRAKYFHRQRGLPGDDASAVARELQDVVRFRRLNLMDDWPFRGPFDFIFCRNVMIYFDKPTQQKLVGRFWDVLRPRGMLFTGHSESLAGITHRFLGVCPATYIKDA